MGNFSNSDQSEKLVLRTLKTGVVVHATDTSILYSNPRAAELLGLTEEQLQGKTALDPSWRFLDEDGTILTVEQYPVSQVIATQGNIDGMILGIVSPMHSKVVWVSVSAVAVYDDNNELSEVVINFHDISRQKELENSLKKQSHRYKMLLQNSSDGVCVLNESGVVEEASDSWCEMLGCSRASAIGMHVSQWEVDSSSEMLSNKISSFFIHQRRVQFETMHRRLDGTTYEAEMSLVPVEIEGQKLLFCTSRDISAKKAAKKQLEDSLLSLNESVKAGRIGIWDWDLVTNEVSFSKEYKAQIGYEEHEFKDDYKEWEARVHPDDLQKTLDLVKASIDNLSQNHEVEFRFKHRDGSYRWILSHASVIRGQSGKPIRMIGSHIDVTETKNMQEELRQSQKMEAIGHLAGGIAHDFNNQLTSILGFAELLEVKLHEPSLLEYAKKIITSAEHSRNLTSQLLTFSRKQQVLMESMSLHEKLRELTELLEHSIDKSIEIRMNLKANDAWIAADKTLLFNAFLNLCLNARDAMPNGGLLSIFTRDVTASELDSKIAEPLTGEYIEIVFQDNGIGIPPEYVDKIFEPFFTTKEVGKGTGMGLASVYGGIKQLNGYIRVQSESGNGTRFYVYLPKCQSGRIF